MQRRRLLLGLIGMVGAWALGVAAPAGAQTVPVIVSDPPGTSVVGNGYIHQFQTTPQTPDPTYSVTNGTLPPGVTLTPEGFLTGTATQAGTFGPTTVCANNGVDPSACQTFTITILKRSPGVLDSASPGGPVGTPVRDTVTLVGAYQPTGTVTFRLFSDPACTTEVFTSTTPLNPDGTATSADFVPTAPGTYRWTASYSGDVNNNPVESTCATGNTVTITGTTTSTTPTSTSTSTSSTVTTSTSSTIPTTTTSTNPTTSTTMSPSSTTTSIGTTTPTTVPPSTTTSAPVTSTTSSSTTTTAVQPTSTSSSTSTSTTAPATSTTSTVATTTTSTTPPAPGPPAIQATPQQVSPGQNVTVTGSGFPPGSPMVAELFSDPVVLGTTSTDANGAFSLVVTIPTNTSPGLHTLRVRTVDGTVFADTTLAVIGTVATTAPQVNPGALSRTGSDTSRPVQLAFGVMVAGFVLVGLSRRVRSAPGPQWRGGRRRW